MKNQEILEQLKPLTPRFQGMVERGRRDKSKDHKAGTMPGTPLALALFMKWRRMNECPLKAYEKIR